MASEPSAWAREKARNLVCNTWIPAVSHEIPSRNERTARDLIETWLRDNAPGSENTKPRAFLLAAIHEAGRPTVHHGEDPYLTGMTDREMRDICSRMCDDGIPALGLEDGYCMGGASGHYMRDLIALGRMILPKIKGLRKRLKAGRYALEAEHRRNSWRPIGHQLDLGILVEAGKR